jgi:hypothetical protein
MSANAPSQTVFSIGYDFHVGNGASGADNGNVWGITNYKDTTHGRDQTFTYDALNRLTSAQNGHELRDHGAAEQDRVLGQLLRV